MSFDDIANGGAGAARPLGSRNGAPAGLSVGIVVGGDSTTRASSSTSSSYVAGGNGAGGPSLLVSELNRLQAMIDNINQSEGRIRDLIESMGTNRDSKENRAKLFAQLSQCEVQCRDASNLFKSVLVIPTAPSEKEVRARRDRLRSDLMRFTQVLGELGTQAKSKASQPIPLKHSLARDEEEAERTPLLDAQRNEIEQVGNELDYNDLLIQDRDRAIQDLETSVVAVNEIFHDLARLVDDQQTLVNAVETNIVGADDSVDKGVKDLEKANTYVKKSRSKLCIIMVIALVIVLVIGLAITLSIVL
ncbi:hypothetical protein Pelo_3234 [Pelomyxa schiedti]|nr:hypothetical protein Pelo_3234 [Pelomyxa schiedti]